jgi:hypothetical protein
MISSNKIFTSIKKIIGDPYFRIFFPALVAIICFLIYNDGKKMQYQFLRKIESLEANKTEKNSPSKRQFASYFAIYNIGKEIIDNSDFIGANNIIVSSKTECKIINIQLVNKNRTTLKLSATIDSLSGKSVYLNLLNDEVFEINDVVIYKIIYQSKNPLTWFINSRIKGSPDGITKGSIHRNESKVFYVLIILDILLISIILFRSFLFFQKKKPLIFRIWEVALISVLFLSTTIIFMEYLRDKEIHTIMKNYFGN